MEGAIIDSIELFKLMIPLKQPFVISLGPIPRVANVVVVIRTKDGCTGHGECSPYMTINGESIDTCFVVGTYLAEVMKGRNALDIASCVDAMDRTIYANNSIKSAFDIALHDIAAQQANVPLYRYLGGTSNKLLETDMTVSIGDPTKMREDAVRYKEEGFPAIKVKLGGLKRDDVERIAAIRAGIGDEIPLRIDANQGWETPENAIDILQALDQFGIEHCEEPISRHRFMELARVSEASPIPIMADESCGDHWDAQRLIQLRSCQMFNIKSGKSGGFHKGSKIAELGAAAGIQLQVGGFMESRLGMTAAAHLALSNHHIILCDFDTPLMFTEDPVIGGIRYGSRGSVELPDVPGLGAVIDPRFLAQAERWRTRL